jgi:hypothetical protein
MNARFCSLLVTAGALALSTHAFAFCRATTCNPSMELCERDRNLCLTTGKPLYWASSCTQVYMQADGLPSQGISFDAAQQSLTRAFAAWLSVDCAGAPPLLDVQVPGPITCGASEYNPTQKNANLVVFRSDEWPYIGGEDALGFTHLTFNSDTGELWDADIEINAVQAKYSIGDPVQGADLDSVLTHEVGHLLGLAHTLDEDATMFASYTEGTNTLRSLAADDKKAMCAAYPPDRTPSRSSCSPRHGFSDACSTDQPANSATNEGTDQEATSNDEVSASSKGCAFVTAPPDLDWCAQMAALAGAFGLCVLRRRARHQFVSCGRSVRQR